LIHDVHRPEDLNSDGEDHAADAIRYGLMRLRNNKAREESKVVQNESGFRFGIPVGTWQHSQAYGGSPHPYQQF
jgi:hypothetical protein